MRGCVLLNGIATQAFAKLTPGMVLRGLIRFLRKGEDFFTRAHFGLALLFVEDGGVHGLAFVENGDLTCGVLTDGDLSLT